MKALAFLALAASAVQAKYWMEEIRHQGVASFNPDKSYQVFRNVKDFGAKGDGVHDDTAAINNAISSGNRCAGNCTSSTTTPAVVYFPSGTYLISSSIIDYYYTQIIGDPINLPVLKGCASFHSDKIGLIDSNPYMDNGELNFKSTNVFFRQIRNMVFDTTDVPGKVDALHWPSSQATSIQNCVFKLSTRPEDNHVGIFMEEGSGGIMTDLVFHGGKTGASFGNQQYTMRNLTFYNQDVAIDQLWNWGWTYKNLHIHDCKVGINMSSPSVGSVILMESTFNNVGTAIITGRAPGSANGAGSLVIENVIYTNVNTVIEGPGGHALLAGSPHGVLVEPGYLRGNIYAPYGPKSTEDRDPHWFQQHSPLKQEGQFYERSKPQYESVPVSHFMSARDYGARGDGVADDTAALNRLFELASKNHSMVAFVDAGYYKVTDTVYVPGNVNIVGEGLASVILGSGKKFSDIKKPHPVLQIGKPGESGRVELSDLIVSTQGATAGAILIEYNLATPSGKGTSDRDLPPSGLWDVHIRLGGFAGSELQVPQCIKNPSEPGVVKLACIAAYMSMHITKTVSNVYLENDWIWVADHDLEDKEYTQIDIYAGRGLLIEGSRVWLVASSSEHHTLYQYQLVNAQDVWMGQIQTETPYYQPGPTAPAPFVDTNKDIWDPTFNKMDCDAINKNATEEAKAAPCEMAWGLRVLGSQNVVVYGAGLYSFFKNYNDECAAQSKGESCQARVFWVDSKAPSIAAVAGSVRGTGLHGSTIEVYNLNTVGVVSMLTREGTGDLASWDQNRANFTSILALFQIDDKR